MKYDTRPDQRDPAMQFHLPNGRRKDDDPPLARQAIYGFPKLPGDGAVNKAQHGHHTQPPARGSRSLSLVQ